MKSKISPEEYNRIIKSINLDEILLVDSSFKRNIIIAKGGTISLKIKEKHTFEDKEKSVIFYPFFSIEGVVEKEDSDEKETLFVLKMKFASVYTKNEKFEIKDDFLKIFQELSLSNVMWPYFRELTQSLVSRANLPPITLPLKKTFKSK